MKYKSLMLCLSILVMVFAGCSSQSSDEATRAAVEAALAAERASVAEHAQAEEQARIAAEQAEATKKALAAAEQALALAKKANSAEQARAAEEAKAKAEAEHAKAEEEAKAKAEQRARAAEEKARIAEEARAATRQANVQTITLAAGTPIKVITSSEISTKDAKTGEAISVVLNEDITSDGNVIASRGSTVKGVISDSDPGGRVKGVATLSVALTSLKLDDGRDVSITTNVHTVEAASSVGKDVAKTGIGAGIGAAIGAIAGGAKGAAIGAGIGGAAGAGSALATHGEAAVIATETPITFNLAAPLTFTPQRGRR